MDTDPILVADDEPHILYLLTFTLQNDGWNVVTALDGEAALERFREVDPALVILDAAMPKRDGYDVAREIRADVDRTPRPYVIMLTAGGQEADRGRALDAGVDEFMTKPFSPSGLRKRVREILTAR
jgi:DNA-binding response OmpR family regulator